MKRKKVKSIPPVIFNCALPPFLVGILSLKDYHYWLRQEAHHLRNSDLKLKRSYALENSLTAYKQKIHQGVLDGGEFDPYTGDKINWNLISKEKPHKKNDFIANYLNDHALQPAVDHINPEEFGFEICSWISNQSKSCMTSDQFVDFCRRVISFRDKAGKGSRR
ncbi:MAG: hypothetical protein WBM07_16315 [Chitinivibrionales bacterium]